MHRQGGAEVTPVQVGPTVNPCTKGLWLWNKVPAHSTDEALLT